MTSAPSFRLLPVEATEAMRDAASAAVIAEWQAMIAEHRGAAGVARSFVSPSNFRLVLAAINAALSAAPVMAEATGWQEMATAPKDGTRVLAFGIHGNPTAADVERGIVPGDHWWGILLWDVWRSPAWVFSKDGRPAWSEPSHWMPLPDPPAINAALAIAAGQLGEKESGS